MSWWDSDYADRIPVCIVADEGETSTVTIPEAWDQFWTAVLANGYDVVITEGDGITVMDFQRVTWDRSARTGTFRMLPTSDDADALVAWLYYGNAAEVTDRSQAVSASMAPGTATIFLGTPREPSINAGPDPAGSTSVTSVLAMLPSEKGYRWLRLAASDLPQREQPHQGSIKLDEVYGVNALAYAADGTSVSTATLVNMDYTRFYESKGGDLYVGLYMDMDAGATLVTGDDRVLDIYLLIWTADHELRGHIRKRIGVQVRATGTQ